jgi:hypothetical protein
MEKFSFLKIVAEAMKGMVSYDNMMASIQRLVMKGEEKYLALMEAEEERVDEFVKNAGIIGELDIHEDALDALVLRYLRNTQFLASIKEDDIDVSAIGEGALNYWKKAMLFKPPKQVFNILQNKE